MQKSGGQAPLWKGEVAWASPAPTPMARPPAEYTLRAELCMYCGPWSTFTPICMLSTASDNQELH